MDCGCWGMRATYYKNDKKDGIEKQPQTSRLTSQIIGERWERENEVLILFLLFILVYGNL